MEDNDAPAEKQTSLEPFLNLTPEELRSTIDFLVEHRQTLRDEEVARLHDEASALRRRIGELDRRALVEELEGFKDVLALHKRLVENGGSRR